MTTPTFAELLARSDIREECALRGRLGFMAYHGGGLEEMTDVIARSAATAAGASYYGVVHPPDWALHVSSIHISPDQSDALASFLDHVDVVVTVHGFGRRRLFTSLLLGGQNRALAARTAAHLRRELPVYDIIDDLDRIPKSLRGIHPRNPVNLPRRSGVQIELPPRVRGGGPYWRDWKRGLVPHTEALIRGLVATATDEMERLDADAVSDAT